MEITSRLEELKTEFTKGQNQLSDLIEARKELESQIRDVKDTLLRVRGAIQVLSEFDLSAENKRVEFEIPATPISQ